MRLTLLVIEVKTRNSNDLQRRKYGLKFIKRHSYKQDKARDGKTDEIDRLVIEIVLPKQ